MTRAPDRGLNRILQAQNRWLVRLRWAAGTVLLGAGGVHWALAGPYGVGPAPVVLALIVLVWNGLLLLLMTGKRSAAWDYAGLLRLAMAQIYADLVFLALLTAWSGGPKSPVLLAFGFHMIVAGMLQPRMRAYLACAGAVVLTALACLVWDAWPRGAAEWIVAGVWAVSLAVTVAVSDRLAGTLHRREHSATRRAARIRTLSRDMESHREAMLRAEKMAAMGHLATGVAHEITNPLAGIDSIVQMMARKPGPVREEDLRSLRSQIQRIMGIVRQLTAFGHPEPGRMQSVALGEVVRESVEMVRLSSGGRGDRIRLELAEAGDQVRTNPRAVQQVLTNLLVNAIDATSEVEEPRVVVKTRRAGAEWVVEVSDNGHGIAEEHLPRVFEPFFTTKPVGRGTGLGLSICAQLMAGIGGSIEVRSIRGSGASFVLRLPAGGASENRV